MTYLMFWLKPGSRLGLRAQGNNLKIKDKSHKKKVRRALFTFIFLLLSFVFFHDTKAKNRALDRTGSLVNYLGDELYFDEKRP